MKNFENIGNASEKEDKLKMIPEDADNLSVEEAFKHKHIVLEINECFEKTKINLFNNFVSLYDKAYELKPEDKEDLKQKLYDNVYAVRFDPALFLVMATEKSKSAAAYIPELKTLFFPDMKAYKNMETSLHEITHSIGSIYNNPDGSKIEYYNMYTALNEGITEKITVEMTGKKDEAYAPNVKTAQIIDIITEGNTNEAFKNNDINYLEKSYNEQVGDGVFKDLVLKIHGIENTYKEIYESNNVIFDFQEENDINSAEFIKKYDAVKQIINAEESLRINYRDNKTEESKEKYLAQMSKTDNDLKKFEDKVVDYVLAKSTILKYNNGENIDLICKNLAQTFEKHFSSLIDKCNTLEEQRGLMQKFCNIQESFNFSKNKITALEKVLSDNSLKLYKKITGQEIEKNSDIFQKLEITHNLKWLDNTHENQDVN